MFLIVVRSSCDHIHTFFTLTNLVPGSGFAKMLHDEGYHMEGSFELSGQFTKDEKGALLYAFGRSYLNNIGALSESVIALELSDSHFIPVPLEETSLLLEMTTAEDSRRFACEQATRLGMEAAKESFQPA
jgi:hypothetical protein